MNGAIRRTFGLVLVLFAVLVGFTSWWTVVQARSLRENPKNRRALLAAERIKRGMIRAADRSVLASSQSIGDGRFKRHYPPGPLFAHAVGYSFTSIGRSGLERAYEDDLIGRRDELTGVLQSLLGKDPRGRDLLTTLDPNAQRVADRALAGRKGAVAALDVRTGAVRVMVSSPSYEPDNLDASGRLARLNGDRAGSPLLDRVTQSGYPPGSTFKTVTAAAALDTGRYTPDSMVSGKNGKPISGVPLNNFNNETFGDITLTDGLTHSVNTVWAEVGEKLGLGTMADYMQRFGFYAPPPLDYPAAQLLGSGERYRGRLLSPTSGRIDVGRMAIGQDKLLVTPLQMASVAQTIANRGVRMKPFLVDRVIDPDGRVARRHVTERAARVMSADAAAKLTEMMKHVVAEGTGTAAALQGVQVAGKTGTAEIDLRRKVNDLWFIGFTPRVAVAVIVEAVQGGQGGTVAAPVAKQVLQALGG